MTTPQTTGAIHDIGYQRYTGARLGRWYSVRSLYFYSLRTAFGLGRSGKAKTFPIGVLALTTLVAVVLTVIRSQTDTVALAYRDFPQAVAILQIIFLAAIAPELVSRDRRNAVLPLYFSRPLLRDDYALAKLAALASALFIVLFAPMLLMFVGAVFSTGRGLHGAWDEFLDFAPGVATAAVFGLVLASIALFVASLAARRSFAAGAIVTLFLVTVPVSGVLSVLPSDVAHELSGLANPVDLVNRACRWAFGAPTKYLDWWYGPLYVVAAVFLFALATGLLFRRYRKVGV